MAVLLRQDQGPVGVEVQPEEDQVDGQGGADQEEGEEDERGGSPLDPGASNVELPDDDKADNEAEETLVGEVSRDVEPGGPHEELRGEEGCPEERSEGGGGEGGETVRQTEGDEGGGLTVTRGKAGAGLTGERSLEESEVEISLRHPPVGSLSMQQPLADLNNKYQPAALYSLTHHVDPLTDDESSEKLYSLQIVQRQENWEIHCQSF